MRIGRYVMLSGATEWVVRYIAHDARLSQNGQILLFAIGSIEFERITLRQTVMDAAEIR